MFVSIFFVFRNSVKKLCVSWALSLVEYVTVGALKLPVPPTDALKTHSSQSFFVELLEPKRTDNEHLIQTCEKRTKEINSLKKNKNNKIWQQYN